MTVSVKEKRKMKSLKCFALLLSLLLYLNFCSEEPANSRHREVRHCSEKGEETGEEAAFGRRN